MITSKHIKFLLVLVFGILTLGRCLLIHKGFLEDPDEYSFMFLIVNYHDLMVFNVETWTNSVFHAYSSIPETFIRLIQLNLLKLYAHGLNIPVTSTKALSLIGFFNVLISIFTFYIFYKILIKLGFQPVFAILGVLLFGTFVNTNIYVRHIFPYETGLMFQLWALLIVLNPLLDRKTIFKAGLLSAIGFTDYFGYFMFVFVLMAFIIMSLNDQTSKEKIIKTSIFFIPFALIVFFFEVLSQIAGDSYLAHTFLFAETIIQGSSSEGLIFIFKYFYKVEQGWGLVILGLFFINLFLIFYKKNKDTVSKLILLGTVAYLIFGAYVVLTGKMVFYGRVLHMYYPFIVIGALTILSKFKWSYWVLVPFCLLNYMVIIKTLNRLDYPRSLMNEYSLYENEDLSINYINELECGIDYETNPHIYITEYGNQKHEENRLSLVNFCFFKHYPNEFITSYKAFKVQDEKDVLVERKHFMSHQAYLFEYCTKEGRAFYETIDLKIMILKNN